ncbi:MAG: DUF2163 domain-containing protein [Kiloniellaceae bacterium]
MKSVSSGLAAHLGQAATSLATCWKVKRTDGTILGFTEHDRDLTIDLADGDGPLTYAAATGYTRTGIKTGADLKVDNLDVLGVLDSAAITAADIRAGRYDFAEVKIFLVNWRDLAQGALKLRRGKIGEVSIRDDAFVAELRGLAQLYAQQVVELTTPACRADLGDARCQVRLDPPVWQPLTAYTARQARDAATGAVVKPTTFNDRHFRCVTAGTSASGEPAWNLGLGGSPSDQTNDGSVVWEPIQALTIEANVASVVDNRTFTIDYTGDAAEALLTGGLITFLDTVSPTPPNAGLKREVKQYSVSPPTVTLFLPMPFDVQAGDPVTIRAGCDKQLATCRDAFDNIDNFRGEPHVPGNDLLFKTPDAS